MPSTAPDFMTNQCGCRVCDKLWRAWRLLSDVKNSSQTDIPGSTTIRRNIRRPRNAILDLLEDIHQEHNPEQYPGQDDHFNAECRCFYDRSSCPIHPPEETTINSERTYEDSLNEGYTDGEGTYEDLVDEQTIEVSQADEMIIDSTDLWHRRI